MADIIKQLEVGNDNGIVFMSIAYERDSNPDSLVFAMDNDEACGYVIGLLKHNRRMAREFTANRVAASLNQAKRNAASL